MVRVLNYLRSLLGRPSSAGTSDAAELRTAFQDRYHHFKLLLNANNRALEVMTEMEEALKGSRPFGMTFVHSRCTGVATSVWQIIRQLNQLAPKRPEYEILYARFREIQDRISLHVERKPQPREGPLVLFLSEVNRETADLTGGKMANLGEVVNRLGLVAPNGFVVTAYGYERFMAHNDLQTEIDRRIQASTLERRDELLNLSADIQQLIIRSPLPEDLEKAILHAYDRMGEENGPGVTVAMRSSALGEDFAGTSFAGQYRSELNVSREHLFDAYREILASKYSLPAMTYRLNRGLRDEDIAMCVGCLSMVPAVAGGVAYSSNPVDIRDNRIVVTATWGLPKSVVDGSTATDLFVVERGNPPRVLHREIAKKETKFEPHPAEGIRRIKVEEKEAGAPAISDEQVAEIAELAVRIEQHYGVPQDIEWAVRPDGALIILQCRPLQQTGEGGIPSKIEETEDEESGAALLSGGVTASPAVGAGDVFQIRRDADTLRFPEGAVLVAAQSLPRWATLLDRAAAVVTERGSVAGHLANVAREFGIPAVFGVPRAMEILENGRMVTVDADSRRIFDGRKESLLLSRARPRNLMKGSPVYEALQGAAQHITPLRLLDPDSPSFNSRNCETFHDITRFCHEKSVQEMFRFGKDHHFPERSSKQLLGDVPMQWWVLNLDDGFREEVDGKYVRLENIASIPMRAVWEGISAVPWQGPPPVDGKGFMSVMFQSTRDTALVPGIRSRYATRNYFMISRNYCCLSSRFGFHFSILEALVSERSSENYISFQFKGGAADPSRKQRRVFFIRDILEAYDFRAEVKEDTLISRLEDRSRTFMENRLKILGYLIIHTRQLDMIMANPNSVQYYSEKIHKDLETLFPLVPEPAGANDARSK